MFFLIPRVSYKIQTNFFHIFCFLSSVFSYTKQLIGLIFSNMILLSPRALYGVFRLIDMFQHVLYPRRWLEGNYYHRIIRQGK